MQQLRSIVRRQIIKEATKTRTVTGVDQVVDDLLRGNATIDDVDVEILPAVETKMKEMTARALGAEPDPVRGGIDLSDYEGFTASEILDILQSVATPDDFSFEQEFEKGLQQPRASARPGPAATTSYSTARAPTPGQDMPGEPRPRMKAFQPNVLTHPGEPGMVLKNRRQVAREIEKVLMDEFVAPAMGVGMNVLPTVWMELGRLMKQDPAGFMQAFQVALNGIRQNENEWFAGLLGDISLPNVAMNVSAEIRPLSDRITKVLSMYYDAVLKEAGRNSPNMIARLQEIEDSTTREDFEKGFFDALSKTRDIEDQAFAQFMGGPARLGMGRM